MIKFVPAQEEVKTMKTVVIEGKDLLFTLFKLAFYIWIGMWNVRILLVAVKMVIAVGVYLKVIVQHNFRNKENDLVLRTAG